MLKIRASQVGKIMPGVRKDFLKGTEDYLFELWVEQKYGRTKDIKSKYMEKGTVQELEAITLLNDVTGNLYFKNEVSKESEWNTGTCDIWKKREGLIRDIKVSWDVFTFEKGKQETIDRNHDYYWQGMTYLDLYDAEVFKLDRCLVDTPENLIEREQYYLEKDEEFSNLDDLIKAREELRKSLMFGDIPDKDRVYTVKIERNEEDINLIHERVKLCREWWKENLK